MNQARIEQVDTPRQIYERPTNVFVADFIGVSNIFRGRVTRQGGDSAVLRTTGLGDLPLPPASAGAPTDRDMALVVRPELFRIVSEGGVLSGQVLETVYAGSDTRVLLQAADGSTTHLRVSGGASPPIGEIIRVDWNTEGTILVPAS
jgi:putative spermidine/putrescine transport system ATP-binding protein